MLCNNELGSGEQDTETKLCETRGLLQTQEAELKLLTESIDIRALSARDLRKKVNESDNLSHEQKECLFHMLLNIGLILRPSQGFVKYLNKS
jgi:hypothetical protein